MEVGFHLEYFVSLLGAVVAFVLFFAHRERSLFPKILSLYFFCISYIVFIYALVRYGDFIHFPHLWRTQVFVAMLHPALAFIYVRSVLEQRYWFRRSDIVLLALPVLLGLTFGKFYLQPAYIKKEIITAALADRSLYIQENEGILPPRFSIIIRIVFSNILAFAQVFLLYRWHARTRQRLPDVLQNRSIFRWLTFLTGAILFTLTLTSFQYLFQFFQEEDFYWISSTTVMLAVLSSLIYLMLKPNILYGLHGWVKQDTEEEPREALIPEEKQIQRRGSLSPTQREKIRARIENYLSEQKPFLRPGYSIANMSAEISVPLYQLSAFINQQYGQSFSEFINGYRVEYIKEFLLKEPDAEQYTLEALGRKAGFNSRSTFIAAVKKKTGQTPSAFLSVKQLNKGLM